MVNLPSGQLLLLHLTLLILQSTVSQLAAEPAAELVAELGAELPAENSQT